MVAVEVKASLVSPGTELGGGWEALRARQENPEDRNPRKIGYSSSGIVLACADDVTGLAPGDKVVCVGGGYAMHTDFAVVPVNMVVPLMDGVSFEDASYAMLMATGLHALRRADPSFGEYTAVAGMGLVGLLTARLFQLAGCRVAGWDMNDRRLDFARRLGLESTLNVGREDAITGMQAFTRGHGLDHGVIAIGDDAERPYDALMDCMKVSPDGHAYGVITIVGGACFPYKKNLSNVDIRRSSRTGPGYHDKAWERGAAYPEVFVRWNTRNNIELCMELIARGQIDVSTLTTHVVPFDEVESRTPGITREPGSVLGMVFTMNR